MHNNPNIDHKHLIPASPATSVSGLVDFWEAHVTGMLNFAGDINKIEEDS